MEGWRDGRTDTMEWKDGWIGKNTIDEWMAEWKNG